MSTTLVQSPTRKSAALYSLLPTPPASPVLSAPRPAAAKPSSTSKSEFTIPPPGALVFEQRVHRPKPYTRQEKLKCYYSGSMATVTLEPWESWLVHSILLALLAFLYVALTRVLAPSVVQGLAKSSRYYFTGVGSPAGGFPREFAGFRL